MEKLMEQRCAYAAWATVLRRTDRSKTEELYYPSRQSNQCEERDKRRNKLLKTHMSQMRSFIPAGRHRTLRRKQSEP